jgi:hypothetical protein
MSENARKEETTDDSGFCRVRFLSNPGRWTVRDPQAYWFWLAVWISPTIGLLIYTIIRW